VGHAPVAYALLGLYLIHGVLVMTLLRRRRQSTAAFRMLVHSADILWPAFISIFAQGPSPFFLFLLFCAGGIGLPLGPVGNAGYGRGRSGFAMAESFALLHLWSIREGSLPGHILAGLRVNLTEFEPKRLFMLSVICW